MAYVDLVLPCNSPCVGERHLGGLGIDNPKPVSQGHVEILSVGSVKHLLSAKYHFYIT